MIKFGTDGWRGLIARDFNFENVQKVALAVARYLKKKTGKESPTVVIGYDTRFLSKDFAVETALVLAWQGVLVHFTDAIASTPQVSFHTKAKGADLGIVITASHNPAIYNGFKVKANFGGPAIPEDIAELEVELNKLWNKPPQFKFKTFDDYFATRQIRVFDAKDSYIRHIKKKIKVNEINERKFKILFDPMYGAGIGTLRRLVPVSTEIHGDLNPSFGEIDHPEPIGECLSVLIDTIKKGDYDIGIATDGDADRVGLIDHEGNFVDSHKIFMILLKYLYEKKKKRGAVAKTVSLTSMVNMYCEKKNIKLYETPVGFKHIAQKMVEEDILIGGEESGGLSCILHIPERDGLFNAMFILEVMAIREMSLKQLCEELDEEFGIHRYLRRDVRVTESVKKQILNAAAKGPNHLGRYNVDRIDTTDGFKFFVEKGWLLIRASGTEPLIRFYAEADSLSKVNELLDEGMKLK